MLRLSRPLTVLLLTLLPATAAPSAGPWLPVGAARIDITPELPIRLSGYQSRSQPAERVEGRLHARALAIGADERQPVVLITAEVIGIGEETSEVVAAVLQERFGIDRARVAVCATHTHTGPALSDVLPHLFARDLPAGEREAIARYTEQLRERLIAVAAAALAARRPARLAWDEGRVDFATHRRVIADGQWKAFGLVPEGPVDHALPVLRVADAAGVVQAVFLSYACHCTTLGGADNFVHPDWAGDAAARIEQAQGGAPALVAIGCGADANPGLPRGLPGVEQHGAQVAAEVARLLGGPMRALGPVTAAEFRRLRLPLDRAVTREELQARTGPGARPAAAYAANQFLHGLEAGRALPEGVPYPVQTWSFGHDLAMVFLGGEVVSEYSLRLRRELDGTRLWINAYANSVPCYVPSARMYPEGGYEVDNSMDYYGWPVRLAIGTEDRIVGTVRELVPAAFGRATAR